ncbi:hypothetical protein MJG53_001745 [Ovis ammon polii x Ovis aries]|uniref:Uncharacterized protein n=1 Tax=Ovis ammon polii x Ovis aries TaxID=2918886 RepID=A0ACB9VLU9_9CETA|nr:hypothetical protein MJT46_001235 [Ovis ammon polii x Ovis aries]KAI4590696.1 hypothetical protein MJG53_001745 [Ovis ammon polii x Ovis aries]
MEPWKQCAQWLIHCKVLPANHRVTWDSAQVFDLAQTLRDGVLLCQLLNNLRAHSINLKEINLRPQMSQDGNNTFDKFTDHCVQCRPCLELRTVTNLRSAFPQSRAFNGQKHGQRSSYF